MRVGRPSVIEGDRVRFHYVHGHIQEGEVHRFIPSSCVGFVVLVLAWDSENRITEALVGAFSNYTCMCKEDRNSTPERQRINQ